MGNLQTTLPLWPQALIMHYDHTFRRKENICYYKSPKSACHGMSIEFVNGFQMRTKQPVNIGVFSTFLKPHW